MKYFLKRSLFLYFRKKEPRKSSFVFQKVTFRARKCFLFFKKWNFSIPTFSHINVLELTLSTNNIYSVYFFRARKYFLFFKKWNFSIPSLKTLVLFLGEPLQVFNYCFFGCFVSPSIFTIVFGCFHCWLYLFTSLFLLCYDFFYQALCSCVVIPRKLRAFFTLHSFPTYGATLAAPTTQLHQPAFIKTSLATSSSALKVPRPPTEVRNRDPAHLFVWITQYSAKGISW